MDPRLLIIKRAQMMWTALEELKGHMQWTQDLCKATIEALGGELDTTVSDDD